MSKHDRDARSPDARGSGADEQNETARKEKLIAIGFTAVMGAIVVAALMFGRADRADDPQGALFEGPPAAATTGEAPPPEVGAERTGPP
jgi:hypothetical protein